MIWDWLMHEGLLEAGTQRELKVDDAYDGSRLDTFLASQFDRYSRTFFSRLINEDHVSVNGVIERKAGTRLKTGDVVLLQIPHARTLNVKDVTFHPPVQVVFEHPEFLILSKPAGLVMHAPSDTSDIVTLVDWLAFHYKDIQDVGYIDRPGIVHRLDKDTSGLVVIPRTNHAHGIFGKLFHDRTVQKVYYAVVKGHPDRSGIIDVPIGRDPIVKVKMSTDPRAIKPRDAQTAYEVIEYFDDAALVKVMPRTGRTHQIRVHFAAIGHPLIGDTTYGIASKLIDRQALHAQKLEFTFNGTAYQFEVEPPEDFKKLIEQLRARTKK